MNDKSNLKYGSFSHKLEELWGYFDLNWGNIWQYTTFYNIDWLKA